MCYCKCGGGVCVPKLSLSVCFMPDQKEGKDQQSLLFVSMNISTLNQPNQCIAQRNPVFLCMHSGNHCIAIFEIQIHLIHFSQ